jgi:hypothetical protein
MKQGERLALRSRRSLDEKVGEQEACQLSHSKELPQHFAIE